MPKLQPRQPLAPISIGLDIGNATSTAAQSTVRAFMPSIVGLMPDAYSGDYWRPRDGAFVTVNELHYAVGCEAQASNAYGPLLSRALAPHEAHLRYTGIRAKALMLAVIAAAIPDGDVIAVRPALGAPTSVQRAHGPSIAKALAGRYRITVNGREREVHIVDPLVLAEGVDVLRLLPAEQRQGRVIAHDMGGGTYAMHAYQHGRWLGSRVYGGADRILDGCAVSNDPFARLDTLREMRASSKAHGVVRQAFAAGVGATLSAAETELPLVKADRHIVFGGVASLLMPVLAAQYKTATVQAIGGDAPEAVNALAFGAVAMEVQ